MLHTPGTPEEVLNMGIAPGTAALAGVKQLVRELEPVIGAEAAERVRVAIEQPIKTSRFPQEFESAVLAGLR